MRDLAWQQLKLDRPYRAQQIVGHRWSSNPANDASVWSTLESGNNTPDLSTRFWEGTRQTYIVAENFFEALEGINLKIQPSYLKRTNGVIWIQYPHPIRIEPPEDVVAATGCKAGSSIWLRGAFASVEDGFQDGTKSLWLQSYFFDRNGRSVPNRTNQISGVPLYLPDASGGNRETTLEEVLESAPGVDYDAAHQLLMLKILMYIASGDPDLRHLQPLRGSAARREHDLYYEGGHRDTDPNVWLVGFGWLKPKLRHVDGCVVRSHYRWQPCGVGRSQVKLILVKEHERHFDRPSATDSADSCNCSHETGSTEPCVGLL